MAFMVPRMTTFYRKSRENLDVGQNVGQTIDGPVAEEGHPREETFAPSGPTETV